MRLTTPLSESMHTEIELGLRFASAAPPTSAATHATTTATTARFFIASNATTMGYDTPSR